MSWIHVLLHEYKYLSKRNGHSYCVSSYVRFPKCERCTARPGLRPRNRRLPNDETSANRLHESRPCSNDPELYVIQCIKWRIKDNYIISKSTIILLVFVRTFCVSVDPELFVWCSSTFGSQIWRFS